MGLKLPKKAKTRYVKEHVLSDVLSNTIPVRPVIDSATKFSKALKISGDTNSLHRLYHKVDTSTRHVGLATFADFIKAQWHILQWYIPYSDRQLPNETLGTTPAFNLILTHYDKLIDLYFLYVDDRVKYREKIGEIEGWQAKYESKDLHIKNMEATMAKAKELILKLQKENADLQKDRDFYKEIYDKVLPDAMLVADIHGINKDDLMDNYLGVKDAKDIRSVRRSVKRVRSDDE